MIEIKTSQNVHLGSQFFMSPKKSQSHKTAVLMERNHMTHQRNAIAKKFCLRLHLKHEEQ